MFYDDSTTAKVTNKTDNYMDEILTLPSMTDLVLHLYHCVIDIIYTNLVFIIL